ncbi:MAG TPA: hypothetical protein VJY85_10855 [Candidatus Limnocylindria bacterium]|nr:hypothetical protein [Candidatus Limnocylindria bacterium]
MRLPPDTLAGLADGRIDLAFRRWEKPRVRAGGRQRTQIGVVGFEAVEVVPRSAVTAAAAHRAGFATRNELVGFLDRRTAGEIYRIQLRLVGPDPRVALRDQLPDATALAEIERRLARLDRASAHGPWTLATLRLIAANPERRAADLAAEFGRPRLPFKVDVRKLKELGLTESLPIGYRLSPRGQAILAYLESR